MKKARITFVAASLMWWGCAATHPLPTQQMADAESALRSARELGAESKPTAQLSLSLADKQVGLARDAIERGDNQRAEFLLVRARADAELALAQAREQDAKIALKTADDISTAAATATANAKGEE